MVNWSGVFPAVTTKVRADESLVEARVQSFEAAEFAGLDALPNFLRS